MCQLLQSTFKVIASILGVLVYMRQALDGGTGRSRQPSMSLDLMRSQGGGNPRRTSTGTFTGSAFAPSRQSLQNAASVALPPAAKARGCFLHHGMPGSTSAPSQRSLLHPLCRQLLK